MKNKILDMLLTLEFMAIIGLCVIHHIDETAVDFNRYILYILTIISITLLIKQIKINKKMKKILEKTLMFVAMLEVTLVPTILICNKIDTEAVPATKLLVIDAIAFVLTLVIGQLFFNPNKNENRER